MIDEIIKTVADAYKQLPVGTSKLKITTRVDDNGNIVTSAECKIVRTSQHRIINDNPRIRPQS